MKNKLVISLLLCFSVLGLNAQSLDREVISNGGNELKKGSISLEYTIAETIVGELDKSSINLSQGFNQANLKSSGSVTNIDLNSILVYPNPSNGLIYLKSKKQVNYRVYNQNSQLISQGELKANLTGQIDGSSWESGIYQVIMTNKKGQRFTKRIGKI